MKSGVVVALLVLLIVAQVEAQSRSAWFGGVGLSVPTGDFNTYADNGVGITAGWEHTLGAHPTALRLDFSYAVNTDTSGVGFHETTRLITAMANVVYHFRGARPRLYMLFGAGLLNRRFSSGDPEDAPINDSHPALQIGEGLIFPVKSAAIFIEGRFVETVGGERLQYFPIVVGVRFGGRKE